MTTEPNDGPGRLEDVNTRADSWAMADVTNSGFVSSGRSGLAETPSLHAVVTFDDFYRLHYVSVAKALAITLANQQLGAEAADEAMARAFAKWHSVSTFANPAGWAYKVGLNWARSWHRTAARRSAILQRFSRAEEAEALPATADLDLRAALINLDEKYRSVVVCRYLMDWNNKDTAEALGLREGTVKSRLSKGLELLRSELDVHDDSPTISHDEGGRS